MLSPSFIQFLFLSRSFPSKTEQLQEPHALCLTEGDFPPLSLILTTTLCTFQTLTNPETTTLSAL